MYTTEKVCQRDAVCAQNFALRRPRLRKFNQTVCYGDLVFVAIGRLP